MKELKKRIPELVPVYYFNHAGASNTPNVIDAVKRRIRMGGISKILVASESGRLALKLKRMIIHFPIVCVTVDEKTRRTYRKPALMRDALQKRRKLRLPCSRDFLLSHIPRDRLTTSATLMWFRE